MVWRAQTESRAACHIYLWMIGGAKHPTSPDGCGSSAQGRMISWLVSKATEARNSQIVTSEEERSSAKGLDINELPGQPCCSDITFSPPEDMNTYFVYRWPSAHHTPPHGRYSSGGVRSSGACRRCEPKQNMTSQGRERSRLSSHQYRR